MIPTNYNIKKILEENSFRRSRLAAKYNPLTGEGSVAIPRRRVQIGNYAQGELGFLYIPQDMIDEEENIQDLIACGSVRNYIARINDIRPEAVPDNEVAQTIIEFCKIRMEYDFEYWAYTCIRIKDKVTGKDVPFRLNFAQRARLLPALENQRRADKPIRIILLKARQWGGSTLTQLYMLWIQMIHRTGWNSVIAAHKKSGSRTIRGMVTKAINYYPQDLFGKFSLARWENSNSTSIIEGRNNKITIGTAQVPDSVRSEDIAMAHLSEVAYWQEAEKIKPEDLIASIAGSVLRIPYSLVVLESTANGTGNFFYNEWNLASEGKSDKTPVFVPWFEIEIYSENVSNYEELINSFDDYHWDLWEMGASLEAIQWWMNKRKEMRGAGIEKMYAEYPSNPTEAFVSTGRPVFNWRDCENMKSDCEEPRLIGFLQGDASEGKDALKNLRFVKNPDGELLVWNIPQPIPKIRNRYIVSMDIGGRSDSADYSVIAVFDRANLQTGGKDELVAQWRGHIDHDLLCWIAAQIATWYCNALLVIESNTLESNADTDGDHTEYILDTIADIYPNLYDRQDPERIRKGLPAKWGFHTNSKTKTSLIDHEIKMYRTHGYIEHYEPAIQEHLDYEKIPNGKRFVYAAKQGKHDDMLMTRAIAVYVSHFDMPLPSMLPEYSTLRHASGQMSTI
ncbi:MAG: hypothetical protein IJS19_00360 [Muribaculaceae bacterium]|nr:hypothetical protein [Muribaculaceae bacterium]